MAGKRTHRPRAIPPQYRTGADERAATAGDRYFHDLDVDGCGGFRDRETGQFHRRPTLTASERHDEIEQLNGRAPPASNISRGILQREGRKVKADDPLQLSVVEWVERLIGDPTVSQKMQEYRASRVALSLAALAALMAEVGPAYAPADAKTLDAVSQHLARYFEIRRAEQGKIAASHDRWADET